MNAPEKKSEPEQAKKAYRSPIIHYYGAIGTITENLTMSGMNDNAMTSSKTS